MTSMIDYHVRTLLCNHATGAMEAYMSAAIANGLDPILFPVSWRDGINAGL
ncbi:hypothetical protein DSCO28_36320 [Desulfosarcina ovata subsp. sediminis]|uniref:Uncharacterized protein n=1 Tax=Desulfosarcina ovata subsp. sediminis TaxID=885957 RepID=A0A5K7ZS81_9BACT|nr:hypothetical protein DSCO28_36320 [Desulfosarcina ovata subsp. sediminis]